jgi:hypothetical protein
VYVIKLTERNDVVVIFVALVVIIMMLHLSLKLKTNSNISRQKRKLTRQKWTYMLSRCFLGSENDTATELPGDEMVGGEVEECFL